MFLNFKADFKSMLGSHQNPHFGGHFYLYFIILKVGLPQSLPQRMKAEGALAKRAQWDQEPAGLRGCDCGGSVRRWHRALACSPPSGLLTRCPGDVELSFLP